MCLAQVRTYFRNRMEFLGYEEWRDGFNKDNIPSTLIDRVFHLESGDITPTVSSHQVHAFSSPITIRIFLKGFLDPAGAIDNALETADTILDEILLPSNRLGTETKDIVPTGISVNPLNTDNDNSVLLELNFEAKTFKRF